MREVFDTIAEEHRREILLLVAQHELSAGEIAEKFTVSRTAISQHLTILKRVGLISERRQGTARLYRARPQGMAVAKVFLDRFWDDGLERLQRDVERSGDRSGDITLRLSVEREVDIAAPPETVWQLLTRDDQMTRWMGLAAVLEPVVGGRYRVEIVPGSVVVGEFVEVDEPHRLTHTWGWEGDADPDVPVGSTIVTYDVMPSATGTLLRVTHRSLPTLATTGSHSQGWSHYLARLATAAQGGSPGTDPWATDPALLQAELSADPDIPTRKEPS